MHINHNKMPLDIHRLRSLQPSSSYHLPSTILWMYLLFVIRHSGGSCLCYFSALLFLCLGSYSKIHIIAKTTRDPITCRALEAKNNNNHNKKIMMPARDRESPNIKLLGEENILINMLLVFATLQLTVFYFQFCIQVWRFNARHFQLY